MTWLPEEAPGATAFARVLGLCPELCDDHRAFEAVLWSGIVEPALLELCRLRIAALHGCASELAERRTPALPEEKRTGVARWREAAGFSDVERAALALAERFALEPQSIADRDVAAVAGPLGPPGLVALMQGLAFADGFARFRVVLGIAGAEAAVAAGPRGRPVRSPAGRPPSSTPRLAPPGGGTDAISQSVLAHQPELLRAFLQLYGTLWSHGVVDHATKEVLRIRNARVTGCSYCRNVRFAEARREGLGEDAVALVEDGWEESALPARHKAALRLADAFLLDPHGLGDDARAALLAHFTPPQIVEMTAGLALFMGFSKITVALGREPAAMPTTVVPTPRRPTQ